MSYSECPIKSGQDIQRLEVVFTPNLTPPPPVQAQRRVIAVCRAAFSRHVSSSWENTINDYEFTSLNEHEAANINIFSPNFRTLPMQVCQCSDAKR